MSVSRILELKLMQTPSQKWGFFSSLKMQLAGLDLNSHK